MSVTAPQGFEAAGVATGLKSTGALDVAVVVNRGPRKIGAAVFTTNRAKANPIIWSQQAIADRIVEAIVLNSGGANCFTGAFGFQTTHQTAEKAAELLPDGTLDGDSWKLWTDAVKDATGAKGKSLFMPLRLALTGQARGPEMAVLLPLIDRTKIVARLCGQAA